MHPRTSRGVGSAASLGCVSLAAAADAGLRAARRARADPRSVRLCVCVSVCVCLCVSVCVCVYACVCARTRATQGLTLGGGGGREPAPKPAAAPVNSVRGGGARGRGVRGARARGGGSLTSAPRGAVVDGPAAPASLRVRRARARAPLASGHGEQGQRVNQLAPRRGVARGQCASACAGCGGGVGHARLRELRGGAQGRRGRECGARAAVPGAARPPRGDALSRVRRVARDDPRARAGAGARGAHDARARARVRRQRSGVGGGARGRGGRAGAGRAEAVRVAVRAGRGAGAGTRALRRAAARAR